MVREMFFMSLGKKIFCIVLTLFGLISILSSSSMLKSYEQNAFAKQNSGNIGKDNIQSFYSEGHFAIISSDENSTFLCIAAEDDYEINISLSGSYAEACILKENLFHHFVNK